MDTKLPYYMAYPMPLLYDDERIDRRDFEYMKSLYPETARRLLPYIEDECYDRAKEKEENPGEWLRDLIQVMMYQEVYKRRSDRRKYGKKYFQGINMSK